MTQVTVKHRFAASAERVYDEIVQVNPRQPLTPVCDRSANAESKRWKHLGERAAIAAEDDAGTEKHDAHAVIARADRGPFPVLTELREEVAAGR